MNRKKVLYILHDIQIGGVEVALMSAIPDLNQRFDLKIIALGKISDKITAKLTAEEKKCLYSFDYKIYWYPFVLVRLLRMILKFDPDIMICSLWRASLMGAAVKFVNKKILFFSFIHSTAFTHLFNKFFSELAIRTADRILADSKATADFVMSSYKPKVPVRVISFFVNPCPVNDFYNPIKQEEIKMMFLGRINSVKNLPLTIDIIAHLRSSNLNVTLDIYGRADGAENEISAYITQKELTDHVRFKGELYDSKPEIMRQYNFLIQLSSREGMAMSVVEAMQNGLVCIVTPVGEIPNYAVDMESAIFVDIWNSEEWISSIAKIEKVIKNKPLFQNISKAGRDRFRNAESYSDSLIKELSLM